MRDKASACSYIEYDGAMDATSAYKSSANTASEMKLAQRTDQPKLSGCQKCPAVDVLYTGFSAQFGNL